MRVAEAAKGVGKPKVGGPFELVDQNGKPFSDRDMKGKYGLVCTLCHSLTSTRCGKEADEEIYRSISDSPTALTSAPKSLTKWQA
jgi:protein SCO1/2